MLESTQSVFDKICGSFREMGLDPEIIESDKTGCVGLHGRRVPFDIYFQVRNRLSLLELMIHVPLLVQEESRIAVAELIARANSGWPLGHLSLDMSTGLLVWHASMPIEDGSITTRQIGHLLSAGMGMIDRYLPAINRLIYADDLSPAEAVAEVQMAALSAGNRERRAS